MNKRIIILFLTFVMMCGNYQTIMAASGGNDNPNEDTVFFTDIENHWARSEISELAAEKVVNGFSGTFLPDEKITKAEFASMLCGLTGKDKYGDISFKDVSKSDWYYDCVKTVVNRGYVSVEGDMFNPGGEVTLKDAVTVLYRLCETKKNDNIAADSDEVFNALNAAGSLTNWERQAFAYFSQSGMLYKFYGAFSCDVSMKITRGEAAVLIYRLKNHLGISAAVSENIVLTEGEQ